MFVVLDEIRHVFWFPFTMRMLAPYLGWGLLTPLGASVFQLMVSDAKPLTHLQPLGAAPRSFRSFQIIAANRGPYGLKYFMALNPIRQTPNP